MASTTIAEPPPRSPEDGTEPSTSDRSERERLREAIESATGIPFTSGNAITRYRNGDEIFPAMLEAVRGANERIEFLTFIYWSGDIAEAFADALSERARAGVAVRVLLDAFGALKMSRALVERMEAAGAEVRWFRPLSQWRVWRHDNRTHRKLLIVDGRIGFTGGVGIAEEWEGNARNPSEWRDSHYSVQGPAVCGLLGAFWSNWMEVRNTIADAMPVVIDTGAEGHMEAQVVRSSASIRWSDVAMLFDVLISLAKRRLHVSTAYFAPDPSTASHLRQAAERGVDVRIMFPGKHADKRISELSTSCEFNELIESGVKLLHYQHTMLHVKQVLVDDTLACIGSANFNQRSMRQDEEVVLVALDEGLVDLLSADFDDDLRHCEPLTPGKWKRRGTLRSVAEAGARLFWRET